MFFKSLTHNMVDVSDFSLIIDEFDDGIPSSSSPTEQDHTPDLIARIPEQINKVQNNQPVMANEQQIDQIQQYEISDNSEKKRVRRFTAEELVPQTMIRKAKKVQFRHVTPVLHVFQI